MESEESRIISLNRPVFFRKSFHNLRNPLVVIKGYTSLMLDGCGGDLSEDHREWIVEMKQNCDHLLTIINTLSELSFIESGICDEKAEDVDICALLWEIAADSDARAIPRKIGITADIPEAPLLLRCDRSLVRKAVVNLMDNAVLFSPEGGEVKLSLASEGESLTVSVRDSGPGFEEEKLPQVLEGYFQGEEMPEGCKGTGLGILISRRIAERYGGSLAVESEQGKGSLFVMTLKRQK